MIAPKNIDDLAAAAESDLTDPKRGVVLKWMFWHALMVGKRTAAEKAQEHEARLEFDAVCRREAKLPARDPGASMMAWHLRNLEDVAAMEAACANVLEVLRRRVATVAAKPTALAAAQRTATIKPRAA